MTTAQVVETSVTNSSLSKDCPHPDDHAKQIVVVVVVVVVCLFVCLFLGSETCCFCIVVDSIFSGLKDRNQASPQQLRWKLRFAHVP